MSTPASTWACAACMTEDLSTPCATGGEHVPPPAPTCPPCGAPAYVLDSPIAPRWLICTPCRQPTGRCLCD